MGGGNHKSTSLPQQAVQQANWLILVTITTPLPLPPKALFQVLLKGITSNVPLDKHTRCLILKKSQNPA